MYPSNKAFSPDLPTLQLAWDSTSYGALKTCPFNYYLSIVLGWQPKKRSIHLTFGLAFHDAMEHYHRLIASGETHAKSLRLVVRAAYFRQLLQDSHDLAIPEGMPAKTPKTLIRTIVWYLDQFENDPATTYILTNGKPAVELSFSFPLDDKFSYCGHFDRIAEYNNSLFVTDYKTSKSQLNARYFAQFSPDIQMTGYTLASQIVFEVPAKGIIVDAVQLGVTFSDFSRQIIQRTPSQLEDFLDDLRIDLEIAEIYAKNNSWPMNPKACSHYSGCVFHKVCSHPASVRENFLRADFTKRIWDPTVSR